MLPIKSKQCRAIIAIRFIGLRGRSGGRLGSSWKHGGPMAHQNTNWMPQRSSPQLHRQEAGFTKVVSEGQSSTICDSLLNQFNGIPAQSTSYGLLERSSALMKPLSHLFYRRSGERQTNMADTVLDIGDWDGRVNCLHSLSVLYKPAQLALILRCFTHVLWARLKVLACARPSLRIASKFVCQSCAQVLSKHLSHLDLLHSYTSFNRILR